MKKILLTIGLLTFFISLSLGQSENSFFGIKYSYRPVGVMPILFSTPSGFEKYKLDANNPISITMPKLVSDLKLFQLTNDNGDVLIQYEKIGDYYVSIPSYIFLSDYYKLKIDQTKKQEWNKKIAKEVTKGKKDKGGGAFEIGTDIAGQRVSLRVNGNITISGKYNNQTQSTRYTSSAEAAKSDNFILDQTQSFNIEGKIGDRISMKVHQDSENSFDFENQLKIYYTGKEDEIVQRVDAGNIGLSLPATRFVSGKASNSGLYGIKAFMKLGPIDLTTIASVEKGQSKVKTWGGSSEGSVIKKYDYDYIKDTYFYLDDFYRNQLYPLDGREFTFNSDKIVTDFYLYISCRETEQSSFNAVAYVDPSDTSRYSNEAEKLFFRKLEPKDYELKSEMGIVKIQTSFTQEKVLAVAYRTDDGTEVGDVVESMDEYPQKLKLIRHSSPLPQYKTWDLELKNVYNLGARNINKEGFDLKIYYNNGSVKQDGDENWSSFLQLFELDKDDNSHSGNPDGQIDVEDNSNVVKLFDGELWFPFTYPFEAAIVADNNNGYYNEGLDEDTTLSSSLLYHGDRTSITDIQNESKFIIEVTYKNRSDFIQLNDMMIIEGSEEVTINGQKLSKGIDYEIDYFAGSVQLISSKAKDPNGELKITYDAQQLFQLDKKTIAGMRAEYKFGNNSFLGGTFMYYNKSSLDDQVRIGEEPFKNYIWDINGQVSYDLDWMTWAINALPLIRTDSKSSIKIDGEVAQIIPNPNTISNEDTGDPNGVAKIDDFEGVKRVTSMGIMYKSWKRASKPTNTFFDHTFQERGFLFWYNPYNKIDVRNIWPNKETSNTEDNGINILNIVLDPEVNGITGHETKVDPRQTWGGIMKPLYSGSYNQTKSKYIEIWAKGETGTIQIDIGKISEDIDNDFRLDTEDGCDTLIKKMKNDMIDEKSGRTEDIGINLLTDEEEIALGWDPKIDNFIRDTENQNSNNAEYRYYNGTENNAEETNNYPDTEDLNRNAKVDVLNDYFTYELNLESTPWIISETETDNGVKTGWKLYRIPLNKAVDSTGNANLAHVEFMRLSFGNVIKQDTVQLASVAIVGNEWQEIGITDTISTEYHKDDDMFAITVVNTEENAEYESPEGVQGKLDKINNIRAKEQSLCLKLNGLPSGQEAAAEKLLYKDIDLLLYNQLKMYIHGDNLLSENTPISVSIRLGRIIDNNFEYYEVETPVYNGWDKRNEILLDFEKLATLKMKNEFDGEIFRNPKAGVKEYHLVDEETGELTGQIYRIVGNPALTRIKKLIVTVKNNHSFQSYTGDIWLDELRVSDTKNEKGMAIRGRVNMKFADVASVNVNAEKKDAEFHEVNRKDAGSSGSQNDNKSFNISTSFKPSKLLPKKWGVSLPVSVNYSESEKSPKYFPGSDIILLNVPDSVKDLSTRRSYSTSISKNTDTDSWLIKNTLEAVKLDFSATNNEMSNFLIKKDKRINYSGKVNYKINFEKGDGISFLKWVPIFGKKLENKKFYWKPNNISLNMNMKESERDITKRINPDSTTTTQNFDMNRNSSINYDPFDNLSMKYTRGLHSNLKNYVNDKAKLFTKFTPGYVNKISESLSAGYKLNLTNWFSPKLNYSTSYSYNKSLDQNYASTSNARKISTNFQLDFVKILDSFKKTGSKNNSDKKSHNAAGRYRPQNVKNQDSNNKNTEKENKKDTEKKKKINLFALLKKGIGKIDPISVTMSETKNINNVGVILYEDSLGHGQTRINPLYRFGLSETPSDSTSTDKGKYTLGKKVSQNLSVNSGIKITKNLSTNLNFKVDISNNYSKGNIYKNMTISYFSLGRKGDEGFPMPNWNVSWNGLESVKFINKIFKSLSISHGYSGGKQISIKDTTETGSQYSQNFSPLIQLNMSFIGDIRSNIGISRSLSINNGSGDTRQSISENANLSISYSYSGGMNIPIPFMKDLNVTNNITFTVNGSYGKSYQNKYTAAGNDENFNKRNNWKIKTDLNYQFTKNINGSAFFTYGESKLDIGPDRISRDYGLKVNIRISG